MIDAEAEAKWPIEFTNRNIIDTQYVGATVAIGVFGGALSICFVAAYLFKFIILIIPIVAVLVYFCSIALLVWRWRKAEIARIAFTADGIHSVDDVKASIYKWRDIVGTRIIRIPAERFSVIYQVQLLLIGGDVARYDTNILPLVAGVSALDLSALVRKGVVRWGSSGFSESTDPVTPPASPIVRVLFSIVVVVMAILALLNVLAMAFPLPMRAASLGFIHFLSGH